eukprot:symbB.v1.2.025668.t1/scaffold2507.1/size77444/2
MDGTDHCYTHGGLKEPIHLRRDATSISSMAFDSMESPEDGNPDPICNLVTFQLCHVAMPWRFLCLLSVSSGLAGGENKTFTEQWQPAWFPVPLVCNGPMVADGVCQAGAEAECGEVNVLKLQVRKAWRLALWPTY